MAYTREETEHVEIDYPIEQIWENISKAITQLEWIIQESNKNMYQLTIKTKGAFMSYPSTIKLALTTVNEKTTRMLINGETPVTTITSVLDFGRTRERIERFIVTLAKLMEKKN
ncbi:MAG: hypothetical protein FWF66_05645 [Candidatus Bathyarchaeota archaeon]|nr:hypothetical protein [Candidatus Termiticorpusculum sp.]MCL1970921.1 hypothetical protein [Candidatus Termiticorpusculum sp.]